MMGDLTKNISRHELRCKCGECDFQSMDFETINVVQEACDHFAEKLGVNKVALSINSAHRCFKHNKNVGSTDKSQHPRGNAMDIKISHVSPKDLYLYLDSKYPDKYGIGMYSSFTHIDTRSYKARWGY